MKSINLAAALSLASASFAIGGEIKSGVYHWDMLTAKPQNERIERQILSGQTLDLERLEISATTIPASSQKTESLGAENTEKLLIVKNGSLKLTIDDQSETLPPGSVAVLHPNANYAIENADDIPATYYLFRYVSKKGFKRDANDVGPGSFTVNWNSLEYLTSEIGGRRNNFDCPTAMLNRFELHTSTLNAGLTNHKAHTHRAEEMVLVLKGKVEMMIGEHFFTATAGDVFFIEAEILHSLRNVGETPTEYFALQWM